MGLKLARRSGNCWNFLRGVYPWPLSPAHPRQPSGQTAFPVDHPAGYNAAPGCLQREKMTQNPAFKPPRGAEGGYACNGPQTRLTGVFISELFYSCP